MSTVFFYLGEPDAVTVRPSGAVGYVSVDAGQVDMMLSSAVVRVLLERFPEALAVAEAKEAADQQRRERLAVERVATGLVPHTATEPLRDSNDAELGL